MLTFREAAQRCQQNNCRIKREGQEYRVTHLFWRTKIEERAYYTDDLLDAALTSRRLNDEEMFEA